MRAERDRLRGELDQAPRDRARELARATARREQADQALAAARQQHPDQTANMLRQWRGAPSAEQRGVLAVAEQQADRAAERERQLRAHQQQRAGWLEGNAHLGGAYRQVVRELAWRRRVASLAAEQDRPGYMRELLGPMPESTRGRRAWRQAAARIEEYRTAYNIQDPERTLGREPREPAQRAAWRQARSAVERLGHKERATECAHTARDARSERPSQLRSLPQPGGPERAAG